MNVRVSAESAGQHSWTASPAPVQHPVTSVLSATSWEDLQHFAERVLGPTSFHVGVCYGLTEGLVSGVGSLLSLLKSLELEGVYELVHQPPGWRQAFLLPQYAIARAVELAVGDPELKKAHDQCVALLGELKKIIDDPATFLRQVGKHYEEEYAAKWASLKEQLGQGTLTGDFQAGRITGQVLLDVIMILSTVYGAAELAGKLAAEIPELMNVVRGLKGAKEALQVEKAAGAAGAAGDAAEELSTPAKMAREPKRPLEESITPKADLKKFEVTNGKFTLKADRIKAGSPNKVSVIGRNMDDVRPFAKALKEQGYNVEVFDPPVVSKEAAAEWTQLTGPGKARLTPAELQQTKMFKENQAWAKALQGDDTTVVDIDNPRNAPASDFYEMEGQTIFGDKPQ